MDVVDLFAGPGGVDEGLRLLGVTDVVGIEWDADACATAEAAGHHRVQADVAELDPHDHPADGLWASPPCQAWSMAGKRTARADQARLGHHVEKCRGGWTPYSPYDYADARTPLVLEPLRWADVLRPRWLALEQVPPVLDLWGHYADVLRGWRYAVWCGVLNAADYGVPQTRRRAILMARRDGPVAPPEPTHAQHPEPAGLFGGAKLPWVTMAQALGWDDGRTAAPMRGAGMLERHGERRAHPMGEPAPTVRANGGGNATPGWQWQFVAAGETGEGRPRDPDESPAATLSGKGTAYWVNGNQEHCAVRSQDEPAPTIHFGHRTNDVKWVHERPSTSVCADPRIGRPGHKDREDGEQQFAEDAVRVTVEQAAILQGFPESYPWQSSKTSQFAQVGNAVPPPLAAAICGELVEP